MHDYADSTNPRIREDESEKDKRIAELEAENKRLLGRLWVGDDGRKPESEADED